MKYDPDVFVHAAEMIDSGERDFVRIAIASAARARGASVLHFIFFYELFPTPSEIWFVDKSHRILALLFAAEVARDLNRSSK